MPPKLKFKVPFLHFLVRPTCHYIKNMLLHINIKYLVLEIVCPLKNEFIMKLILFLYGYSFQVKGQRIYNVKKT